MKDVFRIETKYFPSAEIVTKTATTEMLFFKKRVSSLFYEQHFPPSQPKSVSYAISLIMMSRQDSEGKETVT